MSRACRPACARSATSRAGTTAAASGSIRRAAMTLEGWFAREPATEQFLGRSRAAWQEGKPVFSKSPRESTGAFATFAFPAVAQGRTIGLLVLRAPGGEPDERLLEATQAIGSLFGQFLQRKQAEEMLRESEERFRRLTHLSRTSSGRPTPQHRITKIVHGPNGSAQIGRGIIGKPVERGLGQPRTRPAGRRTWRQLNSHLPFRDFEFSRVMPDGGTRFFAVSGEPLQRRRRVRRLPRHRPRRPKSRWRASALPRSPTTTRSPGSPTAPAWARRSSRRSSAPGATAQARRRVHRPRRLQAGERHARPRRGRRLPGRGGAPAAPHPARERRGGAPGRRRVLRGARADAGHRGGRARGEQAREARCCAPTTSSAASSASRRASA